MTQSSGIVETEPHLGTSPAPAPRGGRRIFLKCLWALIAVLAVHQALGIWGQEADYDEYQMSAAGYAVAHGEKLYQDIWDNHGPLHTYMLAIGIERLQPTSHSILLFFRSWSFLCQLGTAALLYVWVRRLRLDADGRLAALSVFLLLVSGVFAMRGVEIRADVPFTLLWMASLALWFEAHRSGRPRDWFLSGLVLGGCFWFSVKTMTLGVSAGLMFFAGWAFRRKISLLPMACFGVGTAVAPALMMVALRLEGILPAFLDSFLGQNLGREHVSLSNGFAEMLSVDPIIFPGMLAAFAWLAYRGAKRGVPEPIALAAVGGAFIVFQFLFLLPTRHSQSMLPAMPLTSLLTSWAVLDWIDRRAASSASRSWLAAPRAGVGLACALALVHIGRVGFFRMEFAREVRAQDDRMSVMEAGAMLQDGCGVPLFFARPTKYKSMVRVLRDRSEAGRLDLGLEAAMAAKDVKYALLDKRLSGVGPRFLAFLRENYIPMSRRRFLVAGKVLPPSPDGVAHFEIAAAGDYHWMTPAGDAAITFDGKPIQPGPVRLEDGPHEARWSGRAPLVLGQLPPERWGRWEGLLEEGYPEDTQLDEKEPVFWPRAAGK